MHQIETYIGCIHVELDIIMLIDLCQQNILARVTRRLTDPERKKIKNGSVFVYEEAESKIRRWTDGQIWSPSRCSGIFLTYNEHLPGIVNRMLFMKKTLTAKLRDKVYHIVAYANLEEEMNGMCCLKYGNRLRLIYEEYIGAKKRSMIEELYNRKRGGSGNKHRTVGHSVKKDNVVEIYEDVFKESKVENIKKENIKFTDENINYIQNCQYYDQFCNQYINNGSNIQNENENISENVYNTEWMNQSYLNDEYFYLENPYNYENNEYGYMDREDDK